MVTGSLARRYARALLAIGADAKNAEKLGADVRNFAKALAASPELVTTLSNPAFPRADRKKIIDALATRAASGPEIGSSRDPAPPDAAAERTVAGWKKAIATANQRFHTA